MIQWRFFIAAHLIWTMAASSSLVSSGIVDVVDFWPDVKHDLTKVTWSHGTNSRQELSEAISDTNIMMIEADVSMGRLSSNPFEGPLIPVMAHPPLTISDISLVDFVTTVVQSQQSYPRLKKGIKLDFKTIEAAREGLQSIAHLTHQFRFPVWVNADIARGPGTIRGNQVDPDEFLRICDLYLPGATLSIGWTTRLMVLSQEQQYTYPMIEDMLNILQRNHYLNRGKKVTYPIRAILLGKSANLFQGLLDATGNNATVTIWGVDPMNDQEISDASTFLEVIGRDRAYVDSTAFDSSTRQGVPALIRQILSSAYSFLSILVNG